jgi:hypothetical protein
MCVNEGRGRLPKLHRGSKKPQNRDGRDVYLETSFNSELHLKYGQYKDNHSEADRNNDPVIERVSKYIQHDLVSVIFITKKYQVYIEHLI